AYAELVEFAQDRAAESTIARAQLQKEILQREQVEAQAARLAGIQAAFEIELNARQQAEQTLQRSQQELGAMIEEQAAHLGSIETELQVQTVERMRLEEQATKFIATNSGLATELSNYKENEAQLRRGEEQLNGRNDVLTKELASVQAELEKEITQHLQIIGASAKLTSIQTELKSSLDEQRKVEEILRRSETELASRVKMQATEFVFLQTELHKEIAQREQAQKQVAKLVETQSGLERELDARQLAEATLQRSQQELESVIQSQVVRLGSIETELQHQTAERLRMEDHAGKVTAASSELTKKLAYSQETEANLRRTQEQLQDGVEARAKELARVEAKLETEISEHVQLKRDSVELGNAHSVLEGALEDQRKIEANLRCSANELGTQVKTQAAEFSFLQTELQKEILRREQVEIRAQELTGNQSGLLKQLEERNSSENALRVIQDDLRVQIQAQTSEFGHLESKLRKENQERLRATEGATELRKIQIALKVEIFEHKQVEDQLRRIQEKLESRIETQASELANTRAALEQDMAEIKQGKEKAAGLATEQAAFKREIAERKTVEESLRQRQSELDLCLHDAANALATTQTDLQSERTKRSSAETELGQVRYSTLELARIRFEFLQNLSRQICQPINRLREISGKLRETALTEEQRQLIELLQASSEALLASDRQVAESSKFQVEPVRFEAVPFDLYPAVEGAIESSRVLTQGKEIELASLIYREVPVFLRGDQNRLRQILGHLLATSIEFTLTGPVLVCVTTESDCQNDVILRFSVSGGSPNDFEEIQRWLEPAQRAADSPTISATGAMLDLAVARQLIEMSWGKFGMERVAEGAVLWFTLRFAKLSMGSMQVPVAASPALRTLVVESHHARNKVFSSQLTAGGVRNSTSFNAVDALSLLRNQALAGDPFGVAIVSGDLPEMNGLTLAKIAKAEPLLNATHFIIAAAGTKLPDETQITTAGVTMCLIRPVTQSQLLAALEKTIEKTPSEPRAKTTPP
ncbi:MAG: ATP-binding protein, partial [Verrucomicrobiota bacterium]